MKLNNLYIIILLLSFPSLISLYAQSNRSSVLRIENDLKIITKTEKSRNFRNIETLNDIAQYIFNELSEHCDTVFYQTYIVDGIEYKNVVGRIGDIHKEKIVIGAHYDVAGNQEGADDNASGLVGVLELSRIISRDSINYQIELVAYTLEEPPFFRTKQMGSYIHATSLFNNKEKIKGMICLEMIGYFNDDKNSQHYPVGLLSLFYGNKGDFITVVQKFGNGKFGRKVSRLMKRQKIIKTKAFKAPEYLPGIDFSDHRNYWKYGYSAVMITNTAFYRNKNYHKNSDTMDSLDFDRMSLVINEVYSALMCL